MSRHLLGDVVTFLRGVTFHGGEAYTSPQVGTLPILRAGNIGRRLQTQEDLLWVPATRFSSEQLMLPGDIAICMSSGSPSVVGKSAILDRPFGGSVGAFCGLVRSGPLVHAPYLAMWLRSGSFTGWRDIQSRGASIQNLRFSELALLEIDLPSLGTQRRRAAQLTAQLAVANQVSDRAGALRTTVSLLAGLVRASLLDGLPGPRVRISDLITEPGAIIDGPFGSNLKGDHYKSSGVRVIRLGNIGLGSFIDEDRAYVTLAHAARLQRHRADVGDVVIAALGDGARPAGRACLMPPELQESIVKADCFRVRTAGSDLDGAFLMHVMNSPQTLAYIRGSTRGATRPRMNLQMLKELEIPTPSLEEQRRIVDELDARLVEVIGIDSAIHTAQEAIDALPTALLRRAFANVA